MAAKSKKPAKLQAELKDPNVAIEMAEEIAEKSIQAQAAELVPGAMSTLGKFSRGKSVGSVKPTANVVRSSARDIVEFAGGRPETRDPRVAGGDHNTTFIIQRFSDGTMHEIPSSAAIDTESREMDPIQVAEKSSTTVSRSFEIPDAPPIQNKDS